MTDYPTMAEVLAMHEDQIERYGGSLGIRIGAYSNLHCIARRPVITLT